MKNILCYGDSNTWGYIPGSFNPKTLYCERFPRTIRWTGLLQQYLGNNYYIIEEGLSGRTTDVDYKDFPGRNGKTYLAPCLFSHAPLDLVILFLGVNDFKIEFNRSVSDVVSGMDTLIRLVKASIFGADMQHAPSILLIGYPIIRHENFIGSTGEKVFADALEKSQQLPKAYQELAKKHGCYYFDAAPQVKLSEKDGIHLDEKGHQKLAGLLTKEIQTIYQSASVKSV